MIDQVIVADARNDVVVVLPLLCRELLERSVDDETRTLAFTGRRMRLCASQCVAAAQKRNGWLAQQPGWEAHRWTKD
jgi:hypothetical protein